MYYLQFICFIQKNENINLNFLPFFNISHQDYHFFRGGRGLKVDGVVTWEGVKIQENWWHHLCKDPKPTLLAYIVKLSKSRKQFMESSILPKNEKKNDITVLWYLRSKFFHSFFEIIEDTINCFRNLLTFTDVLVPFDAAGLIGEASVLCLCSSKVI